MEEEIPIANPPLSAEEQSVVANLSEMDLQAIDAAILENCSERWHKVARIVGRTEDALEKRFPGLSYVFYTLCLCQLVDEGQLDSQGNLLYMRFSEVRLSSGATGNNRRRGKSPKSCRGVS